MARLSRSNMPLKLWGRVPVLYAQFHTCCYGKPWLNENLGRRSWKGCGCFGSGEEINSSTTRSPDSEESGHAGRSCLSCLCWYVTPGLWMFPNNTPRPYRIDCRWPSPDRQSTDRMSEPSPHGGGSRHSGVYHQAYCRNSTGKLVVLVELLGRFIDLS